MGPFLTITDNRREWICVGFQTKQLLGGLLRQKPRPTLIYRSALEWLTGRNLIAKLKAMLSPHFVESSLLEDFSWPPGRSTDAVRTFAKRRFGRS